MYISVKQQLNVKYLILVLYVDSSGEWVLTAHDIECLCTGAGILACGGGGSPFIGGLLAKKEISEGKEIKVVNPFRLVHTYTHYKY